MITKEQLKIEVRHAQRRIETYKKDLHSENPDLRNAAAVLVDHYTKQLHITKLALKQVTALSSKLPAPKYSIVERAMILESLSRMKDARVCDMLLQLWAWYTEGGFDELDPHADAPDVNTSRAERPGLLQPAHPLAPVEVRAGAAVPFDNGSR